MFICKLFFLYSDEDKFSILFVSYTPIKLGGGPNCADLELDQRLLHQCADCVLLGMRGWKESWYQWDNSKDEERREWK